MNEDVSKKNLNIVKTLKQFFLFHKNESCLLMHVVQATRNRYKKKKISNKIEYN